jgi:Tfp pilus assembly protein PilN
MINLLPLPYKNRLRAEENFRLLLIVSIAFGIFLVFLALLFFALRAYLWDQIQRQEFLVESLREQSSARSEGLKNIQEFNATLLATSGLYEKRLSPTRILEGISSHLKPGMYLSSLNITSDKITVTGFSGRREILFEFREDFQKDPLFKSAYFPPSNWVKPADIIFSFSAELQ